MIELFPADLLDLLVFGGHTGYGRELRGSSTDDEQGIGAIWIVAVLILAVGTVGLLVGLSPSSTKAKIKSAVPGLLIAAIMGTPLALWAATSESAENLTVERATSRTGTPEFIISLDEDDLNTLGTTNGKTTVRLQCLSSEGQVVLDAKQGWPFKKERGYEDPHAHQAASSSQLRGATRCRLEGTKMRLESEVEAAETPGGEE
jgi:hypothetical protein